jgi:hypothetical protein
MRASKVIAILEERIAELDNQVFNLHARNERLEAALLSVAGQPAAAAALRPRKEDAEEKASVPRAIGL